MTLKDIPISISYKSVGEESFSKVLNPMLECSKIYKRSVGFFSSSALDFIGEGILSLARNGGHIYLATSPKLNSDDIEAINQGYSERELAEKAFMSEVRTAFEEISDVNARILYELIKENIVDIKIVLKSGGMYHDKLAILEDFDGNVVACVGSNNESEPGYNSNYEKIRVYKSWLDYEGRIEDETKEFESIWSNTNDELSVYDFKDAFKAELLERVEHKGNYTKENKYKMRQYQKDAKEEWIKNGNKGFFVMATGTGKTITSLYSIKDFINNNQIFTVIAVPYKHLVNQWAEDVKEFFPNAKIHLVHGEIKDAETKILASYIQSKKSYSPIIVITTIVSFFLERYENLYNQMAYEKLLLVDEAHNFANKINDELSEKYPYKLGLSATPVFGNNEEKTKQLLDWFGGQVVDLPIEKALGKYLVNYEYHPIFVDATEDDESKFIKAQTMMISARDPKTGVIIDEEKFTLGYRGRLRAISMAEQKHERIAEIFDHIEDRDHTIVYCSDGKLMYDGKKNNAQLELRHLEFILKLINESCLSSTGSGKASKFTASEGIDERMRLIDAFNNGYIEYLVAIRCLDEGINIPSIRSALILSSNDNYREFVQRRGRILRLYKGKEIAHIYDVIVLPSRTNKNFAEIELRRYFEYSRLALNKSNLLTELDNLLESYNLSLEEIKFDNEYVYGGELDD